MHSVQLEAHWTSELATDVHWESRATPCYAVWHVRAVQLQCCERFKVTTKTQMEIIEKHCTSILYIEVDNNGKDQDITYDAAMPADRHLKTTFKYDKSYLCSAIWYGDRSKVGGSAYICREGDGGTGCMPSLTGGAILIGVLSKYINHGQTGSLTMQHMYTVSCCCCFSSWNYRNGK